MAFADIVEKGGASYGTVAGAFAQHMARSLKAVPLIFGWLRPEQRSLGDSQQAFGFSLFSGSQWLGAQGPQEAPNQVGEMSQIPTTQYRTKSMGPPKIETPARRLMMMNPKRMRIPYCSTLA